MSPAGFPGLAPAGARGGDAWAVVGIVVAAVALVVGLILLDGRARSSCERRGGVFVSANEGRDRYCRLPGGSR